MHKTFFSKITCALFLMCFLFTNHSFADTEITLVESGDTLDFDNIVDLNGEVASRPKSQLDDSTENESTFDVLGMSWHDTAYGPGTLTYQHHWYYSDALSNHNARGYMTNITYNWKGNFNGWDHVYVYVIIIDHSGKVVGYADVTQSGSGSLGVDANTIPANYRIVYGYTVDKKPRKGIRNGPHFGHVNATVFY